MQLWVLQCIRNLLQAKKKSSPTFVGFFVYRHLGLVGCNIAIMKRFLPLLILTGLLFGQDTTLVLKNGRILIGTIVSETDSSYSMKVKHSSGGLINFDLPIGIRKDISKNETVEKAEAIAILKRKKAILKRKTAFNAKISAGTCVGIIWLTYYIFFEGSRM